MHWHPSFAVRLSGAQDDVAKSRESVDVHASVIRLASSVDLQLVLESTAERSKSANELFHVISPNVSVSMLTTLIETVGYGTVLAEET